MRTLRPANNSPRDAKTTSTFRFGSWTFDLSGKIRQNRRLGNVLAFVWSVLKTRRLLFAAGLGFMVINRVASLVLPATTRFVIDDIIIKRHIQKLPWIIVLVLAATAVQSLTSLAMALILSKGGQQIIAELRIKLRTHIGLLPVAFYDQHLVGTLVARIMSDVEGVRNLMGTGIVDFIGSLLTALLAFIMLLRLSPAITAVTALFIAVFVFSLLRLLRIIWPLYKLRARTLAQISGRLTESLGGVRVVKGFDAEDQEAGQFATSIRHLLTLFLRAITTESLMTLLSQIVGSLLGVWAVYAGVHMVFAGKLSLGSYMTYNIFLAYIIAPLTMAVTAGMQLTDAVVGIERALEVLQEQREHENPERTVSIGELGGRIVFDHVTFGYDRNQPVLHDVSFVAEPNHITALVGPSGSGKTTIANLICAFYGPQAGQVSVDGVDLNSVTLTSYRRQLGVVFQDSFLFHGTIRENVAFARPHATEEQIRAACRIARIDEFAERFPNKYDTIVGERGVKLSGGQKQRVSIGRALLRDPRILILDEATSNLDSESEQMIQEALAYLMQNRTTIVIAHRLSTIRGADQILVVERGRIVERGTHDELYSARSRYREHYDRQYSSCLL